MPIPSSKILLLLTFLPIALYFSAKAQTSKGFVIKGHIDGIENKTKVFLFDIDEQAYIDTAIAVDGNFVLQGSVKQPTTCWVECKNQYAIVQVENTNITFTSPIQEMRLYAVASGGKEQTLQNELARLQFPYDKVFMKAYDSIRLKQYKDEADKKRLVKIFDSAQEMSQSIYVEFGKRHPNSYLGLDILYRNREHIAADSLKQLYQAFDSSLKYTTKAEGIRTYLYGEQATKGKMLIDFAAYTIDGKPFRLSSLKGNYILLSFWSSGCAPCRQENKKMSKDYDKYNKIAIVSFSIDKNKDAWVKASQSDNIRWINVSDLEGSSGTIKTKYNVQAIPTSFLINKEGMIIEKFTGFDEDFNSKLNALLSKQ